MDDVGQTLLNWASAFGTLEMVGHVISACSLQDASKQSIPMTAYKDLFLWVTFCD